jgi:hypothetical protein
MLTPATSGTRFWLDANPFVFDHNTRPKSRAGGACGAACCADAAVAHTARSPAVLNLTMSDRRQRSDAMLQPTEGKP